MATSSQRRPGERRETGRTRPAVFARRLLGALLLLVCPATLAPALRADGIVLAPVAAPQVTMPDQRALLVWHEQEQTETLVIESRFAGRGQDFAWVVPLPSKPEVAPATRGTLPTLGALFRPEIAPKWDFAPVLTVIFAPLLLCLLFLGVKKARLVYLRGVAVVMIGLLFSAAWNLWPLAWSGQLIARDFITFGIAAACWLSLVWLFWKTAVAWIPSLYLPLIALIAIGTLLFLGTSHLGHSLASIPATVPASVEVERSIVGDYEVAVLSGESAGGITQWLRANKFALPANAEPAVAEQVRAGGYFAAVKLRRAADVAEPTAPAPLVFTFSTPQPVYPMRLTGAGATGPLDVELFVFGDARAEVDGLEVVACAPVTFADTGTGRKFLGPEKTKAIPLSHPALRELCAGTTIATQLAGKLSPAQMTRDLPVRWGAFNHMNQEWSVKFAPADAAWRAALAGTAVLLLAGLWAAWRWHWLAVPRRVALAAVLVAGAAGGVTWAVLPSVPVVSGRWGQGRRIAMNIAVSNTVITLEQSAKEPSAQDILDGLRLELARPDYSFGRGLLPREGDAPGDYQLLPLADGGWELVWIDDDGQAVSLRKFSGPPP